MVTFLPSDYSDATITVISGYDEEGDFVWVDAITEPGKPVIVVGISERVDEFGNPNVIGDKRAILYPIGDLEPIDDTPVETPAAAPTQLTGTKNGQYHIFFLVTGWNTRNVLCMEKRAC